MIGAAEWIAGYIMLSVRLNNLLVLTIICKRKYFGSKPVIYPVIYKLIITKQKEIIC